MEMTQMSRAMACCIGVCIVLLTASPVLCVVWFWW